MVAYAFKIVEIVVMEIKKMYKRIRLIINKMFINIHEVLYKELLNC